MFDNDYTDISKSYSLHYFTIDNAEILQILLVCIVKYIIDNF